MDRKLIGAKMVKRHEFIERTLFLIRKKLSERLPDEDTLDEMIKEYKKLVHEIY